MLASALPISDTADTELVRRASSGDRGAFGVLYERYARVIHGILLTRVRPSEAEDLVQDVFVTAMRKLAGLRAPEAFPGWLAAIARHRAVDHYRVHREASELDESMRDQRPPGAATEAAVAMAAIRALPEAYRETMMLRLVEGLTGPEIAVRTGLTPESVRVNLCRGMKLLRERLGAVKP